MMKTLSITAFLLGFVFQVACAQPEKGFSKVFYNPLLLSKILKNLDYRDISSLRDAAGQLSLSRLEELILTTGLYTIRGIGAGVWMDRAYLAYLSGEGKWHIYGRTAQGIDVNENSSAGSPIAACCLPADPEARSFALRFYRLNNNRSQKIPSLSPEPGKFKGSDIRRVVSRKEGDHLNNPWFMFGELNDGSVFAFYARCSWGRYSYFSSLRDGVMTIAPNWGELIDQLAPDTRDALIDGLGTSREFIALIRQQKKVGGQPSEALKTGLVHAIRGDPDTVVSQSGRCSKSEAGHLYLTTKWQRAANGRLERTCQTCIIPNGKQPEPLCCRWCFYTTKSRDLFRLHGMTHRQVGARPTLFQCERCDYRTNQQSNLVRHRRTHQPGGERPMLFQCNQCHYTTNNKKNLDMHKKTHQLKAQQPMPFHCHWCDYATCFRCHMDRHLMMHR